FFADFINGEFGKTVQLEFEDGISLNRGKRLFRIELGRTASRIDIDLLAAEIGNQVFPGIGAVGAPANDGDHVVEMVECGEIAFQDMLSVAGLGQQERSTTPYH